MRDSEDCRDDIRAQAAEWVVRLGSGPLSESERRDFDRWIGASIEHSNAFNFARATWSELGALRNAQGTRGAFSGLSSATTPGDCTPADLSASQRSGRRKPWFAGGAVAATVLLAACLTVFLTSNPFIDIRADFRTSRGELRTVTLPDGSSVHLDTVSAITLRFNDRERRVELLSGEAFFSPTPVGDTETRPFVVEAANGTTTAVGTQFVVDRSTSLVRVTVIQHRVRVSLNEPGLHSVLLSAGQSVDYDEVSGFGTVGSSAEEPTGWWNGRLTFDHRPLGQVIAELNRYRPGRIVLANTALADRQVSGVFRIDDLDGALATIASEMKARTFSITQYVTVLY